MTRYIDEHKGRFEFEPICRVLADTATGFLSVSGYYARKQRPPSQRALDDERLTVEILGVHAENYGVYCARKIWTQLNREGITVGRDRVERSMKTAGIDGIRRTRRGDVMPTIELRADLNSEDDEGRWWSVLRDAVDPSRIVPGAVVVAGTERYWATVRIEQVDDDGQVDFVEVPDGPEAAPASTATSTVPPDTNEAGPRPADSPAEQNRSSAAQSETDGDGPSRGSMAS